MPLDVTAAIAGELGVPRGAVERALALFSEGATLPFVARYRKEATGGLDEVALGRIQDRHAELALLEARRQTILRTIGEQGKLTPELEARIQGARDKTTLEDLYLPYRPKRRTRAAIARERGLEPLADLVWAQGAGPRAAADALAARLVDGEKGVPDAAAAWQGARDIVAERISDDADVRTALRELALGQGVLASRVVRGKDVEGKKYADYFDHREPARLIPSHRLLALRRGENEGFLRVALEVDRDASLAAVRRRLPARARGPLAAELELAIADAYDRLLEPSIATDVRNQLEERAEADAIRVFAENLRNLLLAAPLGGKRVLAVDPGMRTGGKVAVLDATGTLVEDTVVYPQRNAEEAKRILAALAARHRVEAVAVGNGTGGRETLELVKSLRLGCPVVLVNESGASVYSASELAREELPDKDVTVRGAVSIGRRLQDPLAELVKIDPKSIGVGQYQHDVNQPALARSLDGVVTSCVNAVGVDVNTASPRLLAYVAGIGETLARNIVAHRADQGGFRARAELLRVPRLGPKAYQQAAGFLRIRGGKNALDASAVHPESYDIVERMARDRGVEVAALVGDAAAVKTIDIRKYVDGERGEATLRDIIAELEKPGRDPRAQFEEVGFRDDVTDIAHLTEGMVLHGVVTNVTAFGAFVDIGVHQDGLVHVSELAHRFVRDPAEVVKVGDRVRVKVLKVDRERRRIGLSIKQAMKP